MARNANGFSEYFAPSELRERMLRSEGYAAGYGGLPSTNGYTGLDARIWLAAWHDGRMTEAQFTYSGKKFEASIVRGRDGAQPDDGVTAGPNGEVSNPIPQPDVRQRTAEQMPGMADAATADVPDRLPRPEASHRPSILKACRASATERIGDQVEDYKQKLEGTLVAASPEAASRGRE